MFPNPNPGTYNPLVILPSSLRVVWTRGEIFWYPPYAQKFIPAKPVSKAKASAPENVDNISSVDKPLKSWTPEAILPVGTTVKSIAVLTWWPSPSSTTSLATHQIL